MKWAGPTRTSRAIHPAWSVVREAGLLDELTQVPRAPVDGPGQTEDASRVEACVDVDRETLLEDILDDRALRLLGLRLALPGIEGDLRKPPKVEVAHMDMEPLRAGVDDPEVAEPPSLSQVGQDSRHLAAGPSELPREVEVEVELGAQVDVVGTRVARAMEFPRAEMLRVQPGGGREVGVEGRVAHKPAAQGRDILHAVADLEESRASLSLDGEPELPLGGARGKPERRLAIVLATHRFGLPAPEAEHVTAVARRSGSSA